MYLSLCCFFDCYSLPDCFCCLFFLSFILFFCFFFFFQAEDGIRDGRVTGVQTCALPISRPKDWTFERVGSGVKLIIDHRPQVALALSAYIVFKVLIVARGSVDNAVEIRSEERRVGKEWRSRWWRYD